MKKPLIFASILVASFAAGCDDGTGTGGAGGATASSSTGASMTSSSTGSGSTSTSTATSSGSTSSATSSVSTGSAMGMFSLTSSAVAEGMTLPPKHTCAGINVSPPLAWSGAPAGTMSYAIIFTDKSFNDFKHAAIYDIGASVVALPENVQKAYQPSDPAGAKQTKSYTGMFGYAGPCPPATHTYEFKIYALDVATLPGMTMSSTIAQVEAAALDHDLGSTTLTVLGDP